MNLPLSFEPGTAPRDPQSKTHSVVNRPLSQPSRPH